MKKNIILLSALLSSVAFYSQVGINTETPNATLDVTGKPSDLSKTDGIIAPRLKGSELKAKDSNYASQQTGAIVYVTEALAAVDTTAKTVNVTSMGYYYFDGNIWQKMTGNSAAGVNPWNVENTTTPATLNTQNIYQNGNVGMGNFATIKPISKLDVRGSLRAGTPHADELNGSSIIGLNSIALGLENKSSGLSSSSIGWRNTSSGDRSQAFGNFNIASGEYSFAAGPQSSEATGYISTAVGFFAKATGYGSTAIGIQPVSSNIYSMAIGLNAVASGLYAVALSTHTATASGDQSVAIGAYTTAAGNASTAMGRQTLAAGFVSTAIGERNAIRTGSNTSQPVETDALFQVGNGSSVTPNTSFNNAMTILRNGHTAIGVDGEEDDAKPTELLDLGGNAFQGEGGLRIRNINSADYTGEITDKIVVATPEGVLKTITSSAVATEPFQVSATTTKATANTQNIYQNGNLGLGNFTTANPIARLDVRGAVRGGTPHADEISGVSVIGTNSATFGTNNKASGANSVAFGVGNNISGIRNAAFGSVNIISNANSSSNFVSGVSNEIRNASTEAAILGRSNIIDASVMAGAPNFIMGSNSTIKAGFNSFITGTYNVVETTGDSAFMAGISSTAKGRFNTIFGNQNIAGSYFETAVGSKSAITTGTPDQWITTDVLLQVGNGDNAFPAPRNNAMTILKNAHTAIGVVGTEAAAKPTELLDLGGAATAGNGGVKIRNINSAAYTGSSTDKIVVADATGVLKTVTTASLSAADFNFSSLPTYADDSSAGSGGLAAGKLYKTVNGEIRIKL